PGRAHDPPGASGAAGRRNHAGSGGLTMDRQARKTALRLFSYGLYAVTSRELETRNAFTANWLSQASFEPPIVMVSVERDSVSLGMIRRTGRFGVSVLPAGARELAGRLGHSLAKRPDKLAGLVLDDSPGGLPVLAGQAGPAPPSDAIARPGRRRWRPSRAVRPSSDRVPFPLRPVI